MDELIAAYPQVQGLNAIYHGVTGMIDVDEYPFRGSIIVPKGDTAVITFTVYDENGFPFDVSDADAVEFIVSLDEFSPILFRRSIANGGVSVDGSKITISLSSAHSRIPNSVKNYFELLVVMSPSERRTVAAGLYRAPSTVLGLV